MINSCDRSFKSIERNWDQPPRFKAVLLASLRSLVAKDGGRPTLTLGQSGSVRRVRGVGCFLMRTTGAPHQVKRVPDGLLVVMVREEEKDFAIQVLTFRMRRWVCWARCNPLML